MFSDVAKLPFDADIPQEINLNIYANQCLDFVDVQDLEGNEISTEAIIEVTLFSDSVMVVNFDRKVFTLTVIPNWNGTLDEPIVHNNIKCGVPITMPVPVPDDGYEFVN
jgi:hypothetical protein